jgi:hypothetical protein
MKTVTVQIAQKTEQFQIPAGSAIYIVGGVGKQTGRVDQAIGAICHYQRCGKVIEKGDLIYSKSTAGLHRAYYHFECAEKLHVIEPIVA